MNDQETVIALSRQIRQAMVDQDTDTIDRILTDDATLTHQTGYVQSKQEWIDFMKKGRMRYFTATEMGISADVNGDKARVVVKNKVDALIFGTRNIWNLQLVFNFEKLDGEWRVVKTVARPFTLDWEI